MFKRPVSWTTVLCLLVLVAMAASTLTLSIVGANAPTAQPQQDGRFARLEEIFALVEGVYYTPVDEEALLTGAVRGMLAALEDPYTFYYTPEEYAAMNEETVGLYSGVGMLLGLDGEGGLAVMRVFRDSPAERAGVQAGDRVLAIEGTSVEGGTAKDLATATSLTRGGDGQEVTLEILRGQERLSIAVERGEVNINYVEYSILDGQIGYLSIYQFTGNDVSGVEEAISAFQAAGVRGLVVDVRSNPGGLLDDVVDICDLLLPEGLLVYTEDRQGRREEYYADADYWDVPMAVLVNGMSASASEIFAAAAQESGRAVIVGERTYGKGVVQTLYSFAEGDGVQLTTSAYYTASGRSIHQNGVQPDIAVACEDAAVIYHTPDPDADPQLSAAIGALGLN